jgi:hypothetical protein
MQSGHRADHYSLGKSPSFLVRRFFPAEPIFNFDSLEKAMSVLLLRLISVAESKRHCLRGSPVGIICGAAEDTGRTAGASIVATL